MTAVNPLASSSSSNSSSNSANSTAAIAATDTLGNENTFLQLLVAQIKNQDPTSPVDSSTFLTQLAEFSQLEQLVGIRQDVSALDPTAASSTGSGTSTSGS
jgi:flagellar basal-body rod modification protein FlgD